MLPGGHAMRGAGLIMAGALVLAGLAASTRGSVGGGGGRGELLDYYDSLVPYIGYGGYSRNAPLGASFDHDRPDAAEGGLEMSYMAGTTGELVPFTGLGMRPVATVAPVARPVLGAFVDTEPAMMEPMMMMQNRAGLDDGYRADAARCNGLMHACANWMAIETGKMRFAVYQEGAWCTDDKLDVDTCSEPGKSFLSNEIINVPEEGGALSDKLWTTMMLSCPVLKGCAKPKAMSFTEGGSVYAQQVAPLLSQVQAYQAARARASKASLQCCIAKQTALRMARLQ